MKKFLLVLIVSVLAFTMVACDSTNNKDDTVIVTAEEVEEMIDKIGPVTKLDDAQKNRIEEAFNAYKKLDSVYGVSYEHRKKLVKTIEELLVLETAKSVYDAAKIVIKSKLIRPASFELNFGTMTVYDDFWYYFKVDIDYSAQNRAGGYVRETETLYYYINLTYDVGDLDEWTKLPSASEISYNSSYEGSYERAVEQGVYKFSIGDTDVDWFN